MSTGFADCVIGAQYGDEGKARVIDSIASGYDIIARFNGGANAGHTVQLGEKILALQQVPSGVFYPKTMLFIGSGCVVNIVKLAKEITSIAAHGISLRGRLKISCQATVIQPHHMMIDAAAGGKVGTTKNGIGPAYADRAMRMFGSRLVALRLGDLLENSDEAWRMMAENLAAAESMFSLSSTEAATETMKEIEAMKKAFEQIRDFLEPDTLALVKLLEQGKRVLFEGAQATMLDVAKGAVPYVTSSHTVAGAAYTGGDAPPNFHRKTIGVAKAIMSRVGNGPFASEFGGAASESYCAETLPDGKPVHNRAVEAAAGGTALLASENLFDIGKGLRILSAEYGTVTSRPRRIGMLDLVVLRASVKHNGMKEIALNKCDVLQAFSQTRTGKIPLVTGYELDGRIIDYLPAATAAYRRVKPVVEYREGFSEDIRGVRTFEKLPKALQKLIGEIEEKIGCRISGIGVGPEREEFIARKC